MRIGFGKDIHTLVEGNGIVVGGIKIPCQYSTIANSDGDVLIHSLCDAILGAISRGDIGDYFNEKNTPTGMDSSIILKKCLEILHETKYQISNIDCVVTLEQPKLGAYKKEIIENLAKKLSLESNQVSVKFGTNEKHDDLGKSLAIQAETVILLEK